MSWHAWLLFVVTSGALDATPGPAVLFVLSQAVSRGPQKSVWASAGILSANIFYFALSATSLGAIIIASYNLFFLIKWIGAAYLIYLGIQCWRGAHRSLRLPELDRAQSSGRSIFRSAVMLQFANPKALIYFTAVLPLFVDSSRPVWPQMLILAVTNTVMEFCILVIYGSLAGKAWSMARNPRFETLTNRLAGSLLVAAGIGMARLRRA